MLLTVLAVSFLAFSIISLSPGDPAEIALRVNDIVPTPEAIEEMKEELGLNRSFLERYVGWVQNCLQLDFGVSYTNADRTVASEFARSFPYTLKLAAVAFVMLVCISLPLGVLSAVWKDSLFDKGVRVFIFAGTSVPNFWLAFLLIWLFSITWKIFPSSGTTTLMHYILPAISLNMLYISTYVRLIRNSMLENMKQNYTLYARARGIKEKRIIWVHVLKNSLQSSMTAIGIGIVRILSGTVVIENIFAIPGIGRLCVASIFNRDFPTIQAYILIMGVLFVVTNFLIDILHCLVDPRLKKGVQNV